MSGLQRGKEKRGKERRKRKEGERGRDKSRVYRHTHTFTHTPMRLCTFVSPWEVEVCDPLLVEANVPSDHNVVLCLGLVQSLVIVRLQLHKGAKYILIAEGILVPVSGEEGERGRKEGEKGRGKRERG